MQRLALRSGFLLAVLALSACAPRAPRAPVAQPLMLHIHATAAAAPWLDQAFTCAAAKGLALNVVPSPEGAQVSLRVGEPPALAGMAYQIDTEEILIVTSRESPIQNLDAEQARDLFARPGDSVQVWVYAAGEDVQQAFDRLLMDGAGLTSLARLAATPQEMLDTLNTEGNAVGILPRHWLAGTARAVYSLGSVPVLALVDREPDEPTARLIDCLQK